MKQLLLDREDEYLLNRFVFWDDGKGYLETMVNGKKMKLHQLILHPIPGYLIDHKNRDTYDNRRKNLRYATRSQNGINRKMPCNNTSGFRGVTWSKHIKKWLVRSRLNGKRHHLGIYENKRDAARAYDVFVKNNFGEFGILNLE